MKTKQFLFMMFVLPLLLGTTACDKQERDLPADFFASTWKCLKIVDLKTGKSHLLQPEDDKCYTLVFNSDGELSGRSSSNTLMGQFLMDEKTKSFRFLNIGGTEIYESPDGLLFVESLKQVDSYSVSDNDSTLKLYFSKGEKYLHFKKL